MLDPQEAGLQLHQTEMAIHYAKVADEQALSLLRQTQATEEPREDLIAAHQEARAALHNARIGRNAARTALKEAKRGMALPLSPWQW